jgi:two-component system, LytTR family, response regulator
MRNLRALVVDDEAPARRTLQLLLANHPDVQLLGECATGPDALETIERTDPDLLFLDVHLPGFSGFELLERMKTERPPTVIFVTAYDEHAIRAFDASAADYLLKPFDDERFDRALERAKARVRQRELEKLAPRLASLQTPIPFLDRLAIRDSGRIFVVRVAEIDWIEAYDYYVQLHLHGRAHLLRERMHHLEARLDPRRFVRIHRSAIVNIERVKELQPFFHGEYTVLLEDGTRLKLSRTYRDRLELLLGKG